MTKTKKITLTVAAIAAIVGSANHADAFGGRLFNFFRCRGYCASRACQYPDGSESRACQCPDGDNRADASTSFTQFGASQPRIECGQCLVNPVEPDDEFAPGLDSAIDDADVQNDLSEIERALVAEAIRVRGRVLAIDKLCCKRSRYNSDAQASYCQLGHFTGSAYEIAGVGYGSPAAAVQGWLNSPAHRAILLRADFTKVGAAVRRGRDGRLYWTINFAR